MSNEVLEASNEAQTGEHSGRVSITIDRTPFEIRKGQHRVTELKEIGGVPADFELEQVVDGRFVPLPDDGKVHIRGDEVFISHPKDSASS